MIIRYAKSFQFIEFFIYLGTLFQSIFWIDNLNSYKSIQYSLNIVVFSITWKLQKIFSLDFQYVNSKEPFEVMRVTVFQQVLVLFPSIQLSKSYPPPSPLTGFNTIFLLQKFTTLSHLSGL